MYKVERVVIHPRYFEDINDSDDVALIRLQKDLVFTDKVMPICLPLGPR